MKWLDSETAPKDGNPFLALVNGYPWGVMCVWSEADSKFVYATLQVSLYRGEWNDAYFENEHAHPLEIEVWMPIPERKQDD